MKILKALLLIYLLALLSVTILPKLAISSALPNLILIIPLVFVFQKEFKKGLFWAIFGGLFLDFLGLGFPSNIFLTTAFILLTYFLIQRYFESSNIYLFLLFCFLTTFLYNFFLLPPTKSSILLSQFFSAIYSTFLGLAFYFIYLQYQERFKKSLI